MLVLGTAVLAIPTLFARHHRHVGRRGARPHARRRDDRDLVYGFYLYASFQDPEHRGDISHSKARWTVPLSVIDARR